MLSQTRNSRTSERLCLVAGIAAFLAVLILDRGRAFSYPGQPTFWDAHVYERAIHAFRAGVDPYAHDSALSFVYPPIVLHAAGVLRCAVHGEVAWKLYLLLTLLSAVAIPIAIANIYLRSRWFTAGCALLVATFHPFFTTAFSFFAGNIASILYASVLLAGIPGLRRNRWGWFYGAVVLAACVKVSMLAFLLLPLLLGSQQEVRSAAAALAVASVNAMQRILLPAEYEAYVEAARYQVLFHSEFGFGLCSTVFRIVRRTANVPQAALVLAHLVTCGILAGALFWARKRGVPAGLRSWWSSLVLLLAVLCNPRILAYDVAVLVLPLAYLLLEAGRVYLELKKSPLLLTGFVLAIIIALNRNALEAYCVAAVVCFPVAGYLAYSRHVKVCAAALRIARSTTHTAAESRSTLQLS